MIQLKAQGNLMVKIYHSFILIVQVFMLLQSCMITRSVDLGLLSATEIINVAFDWFGMFTIIVIMYSCIRGREMPGRNAFINLTMAVNLCLFFEAGAWMVDRSKEMRLWNYVYNIGCSAMMLVAAYYFTKFVCSTLNVSKRTVHFSCRSALAVLWAGIAAEILNVNWGYYYHITVEGVYVRNGIGSLISYIPFLYILGISGWLIWKQQIKLTVKMNYYSYIIIPLVVSVWYMVTGYPPTMYIASFASLLILYGNIYSRLGKEMEEVTIEILQKNVELARQKNQIMLSQIKPHFIFNCLGSIEELCRLDAETARAAVQRFSKYLRANMDSLSDRNLIPFYDELEHIRNYVWLEKMRFEDDLDFREDIEILEFFIPPLTIQPLVENAIKHGMMGSEEGVLEVILSVKEKDDAYEILVQDNGAGFDVNKKPEDGRSHIGIPNVRESLQLRVNGTLTIESRTGRGTTVLVSIPKEEDKDEDIGSR